MPNWCTNRVTVTGSVEELDQLLELLATKPEEPFQTLRPVPDDDDWYENRCEMWGTKWEPSNLNGGDLLLSRSDSETLEGCYDTAWSPALDVFVPITKQLSSLIVTVECNEAGSDFSGVDTISNGVVASVSEDVAKWDCAECEDSVVHTDMGLLGDLEFICRSCITIETELVCQWCEDAPPAEGFLALCADCAESHPEHQRPLTEYPENEEVATTE